PHTYLFLVGGDTRDRTHSADNERIQQYDSSTSWRDESCVGIHLHEPAQTARTRHPNSPTPEHHMLSS
ncbi:MAG: hypothetical protein LBK99_26615, partial [Opitutaceae bacterium]|nr:hypothetical protein [Opitutaceae bacterium]